MSTAHRKNILSFMYWNCQGIKSKIDELSRFLKSSTCDVVCLNETFLKGNQRQGFTCIRKDRDSGRLGGLAYGLQFPGWSAGTGSRLQSRNSETSTGYPGTMYQNS